MQNNKEIKIIGVTGGTGTGKSTVAEILKEFGGYVIDADAISKENMKKGSDAYNETVGYFGDSILSGNGEIDRKRLADIIFNDDSKRLMLNKITHKFVTKEIYKRIAEYREKASQDNCDDLRFIVLDVPIPVEEGFLDVANTIWSVVANNDIRIDRIIKRSGISEAEAVSRISSQMTNSEYESIADVVIVNEYDRDFLRQYVAEELINLFGVDIKSDEKKI